MKKAVFRLFLLAILFTAALASSNAQTISGDLDLSDTTQMHKIYTHKGDQFVGRILSIENTKVTFLFNDRMELQFDLSDLREIKVIDGETAKEDYVFDQQKQRYRQKEGKIHGHENLIPYLVPTGFGLKKGETEVRNYNLFLFSVDHGLDDHISIGADLLPFFVALGANARLKASFSAGDLIHFSGSANISGGLEFIDGSGVGLGYGAGAITLGTPDRFLNFSAGYGRVFELDSDPLWVNSLGGAYRLGKNVKMTLTALFFNPTNDGSVFLGNLTFGWFNTNHRIDAGIAIIGDEFSAFPLPTISYAYRFGQGRR